MPGPVKMLTPVDDRKVNGIGCNVMKPPASGTEGRICPEFSLNLQQICENADMISVLLVTFVHQNERVTRQFNVTQNNNHAALLMFCPSELAGYSPHTVRCNAK